MGGRGVGRDNSVGIAVPTGWTVRGSNPGEGPHIPHPSRPALGPTQPPIQWLPRFFSGG